MYAYFGSLHGNHIIVYRLTAAENIDLGIRKTSCHDFAGRLCVLFRNIFTIVDCDKLGREVIQSPAEFLEERADI